MHHTTSLYIPAVTRPALYRATCSCGWTEEVWQDDDTPEARTETYEALMNSQAEHLKAS